MTWLLCDYGQVLSLPQPEYDKIRLVTLSGLTAEEFWKQYWSFREGYDRADLTAEEYWTAVLGKRFNRYGLRRFQELDLKSWMRPNLESLTAAGRAADRGYRLAILSNAPLDLANALDRAPWLERFEIRLFSSRLRLSKPDPAIYEATIKRLGGEAEDIIFIDDREDNIAAAAALGIRAQLFNAPEDIDRVSAIQVP